MKKMNDTIFAKVKAKTLEYFLLFILDATFVYS